MVNKEGTVLKKTYTTPEAEIEKFTVTAVFTASTTDPTSGIGDGNNDGGDF